MFRFIRHKLLHISRFLIYAKGLIDNGTKLAWLINRKSKQVEIYRQGQAVTILDSPNNLSGEDILPGFVLDLEPIW